MMPRTNWPALNSVTLATCGLADRPTVAPDRPMDTYSTTWNSIQGTSAWSRMGPGVGRSSAEGLEVCLAGGPHVRVIDGGERDQVDRFNLNGPSFEAIAATGLHLWSPPQAERTVI